MTYFGFLARFVVLPLLLMRFLLWQERKRGSTVPESLQNWPENGTLLAHVAVAVAYTTPWDNYLVASGVWNYDNALVTGHTIGYVPVEEYSFFVLQTLLAGSWTQWLMRRIPADNAPYPANSVQRRAALLFTGGLGVLWLASMARLTRDRRDYLGLILGWSLPPIMLQTGFGGDILWRHRSLIAASLLPTTAYLGGADSVAIGGGIWAINSDHTTGTHVINHLPLKNCSSSLSRTYCLFSVLPSCRRKKARGASRKQ
ncbi:lycopene cyclase domain-containing protein [bacterium]|nr:lycopene cyclase domain-containing protein [bacterium]